MCDSLQPMHSVDFLLIYFQLVKIIHLPLRFWQSLLLPVKYTWTSAY